MKTARIVPFFILSAALIGAALIFVRFIAEPFADGSTTVNHPYKTFVSALIFAGLAWMSMIWSIPKLLSSVAVKRLLFWGLALGIALRVLFIGSTPIYENDWNRYLWDGAVITQGINPYTYSPHDVILEVDPESTDLESLQELSSENDDFAYQINYGYLTTIYPPVAQIVFAAAALIKPFDLDVLRVLFIFIDVFSIFLLLKILEAYGRDRLWALLYVLNPMLIYAGFNAVHMDIILVPFLLLTLLWIKTKPLLAGVALAYAGAVKLWPLLLAPVLYRQWRASPRVYIASALIVLFVFLALMLPLILALKSNAGVVAYAGEWSRNAFFFPQLEKLFGLFVAEPGRLTRVCVALLVSGLSLWIGFRKRESSHSLPAALLFVTAALFLLSPTGYPWYAIWLIIFIPFVPSYGIAALTVMLAFYYARYALSEQELSHVYTSILIPAQFIIPTLILMAEAIMHRGRNV